MKSASKTSRSKNEGSTVVVVVETPRGSHIKYKFDENTGRMKLSKIMPEGIMFPYDFGYFPDTRTEGGDPLDVLILNDDATFAGCQIDCRLVGVIKANQTENGKRIRNDRLIAVAEASVLYAGVKELSDLEPGVTKQIEDFFVNYQKVRDIEFEILGREGSRSSMNVLREAARKRAA